MDSKLRAKIAKKNPPYIYQFFNVFGFYQNNFSALRGMVRLLNTCIQALNTRPRLPKYLILVPNCDLISSMTFFGFSALTVFIRCLTWLVKQIDTAVNRHKMSLFDKKPGALSLESPKLIWIKMLKRPYNAPQTLDETIALRNRFNNALEEVLANNVKFQHYIMSIKVNSADFYKSGELTDAGQKDFWIEMDTCLKRFDRDEINLKPRNLNPNTGTSAEHSGSKCRKLPTQPVEYRK